MTRRPVASGELDTCLVGQEARGPETIDGKYSP